METCQSFNTIIFADLVAKTCFTHYNNLPKTGKPQQSKEWTHMAAIVKSESSKNDANFNLEVVSMATGSKCVGTSSLSADGCVIYDSHAEVLARRAFLRYLYSQIRIAFTAEPNGIFDYSANSESHFFKTKKGIHFHFFISHTPCGDASIFTKRTQNENCQSDGEISPKRPKIDTSDDIYRTGAKCVPSGPQDEQLSGAAYHVTKVVRTKPGRGDRTSSVSCSDKMAKWNVVGLQGALLSHFITDPIYLSTIVIARCPYSESALRRAIITRVENISELPENYQLNKPNLLQSSLKFPDGNDSINKIPTGAAIIWSRVPNHQLEVSVKGLRQGTTKRRSSSSKSSCAVCKRNMLIEFMSIVKEMSSTQSGNNLRHLVDQTYRDCKLLSKRYQQANVRIRDVLPTWPNKLIKFEMFEI